MGVDVGDVRVGIARGSSAAKIAEALKTVPAKTAVDDIEKLASLHQSTGVVVGLPRSLDGKETSQTKKVRQWVNAAKLQVELPFFWQDEALTSVTGQESNSKAGVDAAAAAIILQDFLNTPSDQRVRC